MRTLLVLAGILFTCAGIVRAQAIDGRVVESASGAPIVAAEVTLVDSLGYARVHAVADSAGRFELAVPGPGRYSLRVEHLAYEQVDSEPFNVGLGEAVEVLVRLGVRPIALDPIEVTARRQYETRGLEDFYGRMERMRRVGLGHFITREDIERRSATRVTDYLRMVPRVQIVGNRSTARVAIRRPRGRSRVCYPQVYIDGIPVNAVAPDNILAVPDLEGIEVYRGLSEMPGDLFDRTGCGVVAFWTRRGLADDGNPITLVRVAAFLGIVGGILLFAIH